MKKIFLYIIACLPLAFSCSDPIVETFGNISGIIRDEETNEPLKGVTVSLTPTGASQVTDDEGQFLFDNLDIQEYTLTFTLSGYETHSQKVSVKPGLSSSVQIVMSKSRNMLSVTPDILDFGKVQTSIRLTLEVSGSNSVSWSAVSSNDWLKLSKESGVVTGTDYLTVTVSRSGLSAGNYDASIEFTVDGSKKVIPVSMAVAINEKPSVSADGYHSLTYNSVILEGMLISTGSAEVTSYGFCWNESGNPTIDDNFANLGDAMESKSFECVAPDLRNSTKYYFRAYATNSVGTVYSDNQLEITTKGLPEKPAVITGDINDITYSSAEAYGTISSTGNATVTAYGHVWGTSPEPDLENGEYSNLGETDEVGEFTSTLENLSANTTYYIRAYVTNEIGTAYGSVKTFKTPKDESLNPTNGLYAWYTFENSNKNTVSGAPNATLSGSPGYTSGVADSKALKLSSSSYFSVPEPMIDDQRFTVSFWVKGIGDGHVFHLSSSGQYYVSHVLTVRDGYLTFMPSGYDLWYRYYDEGVGETPSFSHQTLNSSDWHMITVSSSFNAGIAQFTVKLYIDGEQADTQVFTNSFNAYGRGIKFIFGGQLSQSGYKLSLNGISMTVDNLRIYNSRQLSDSEVKNLYDYEK